MGVVIPFRPRAEKPATDRPAALPSEPTRIAVHAVQAAVRAGHDRRGVLDAAAPLLAHCRDRYGFTVMRDGLPPEPEALASALLTLVNGLALLEAEFGALPFESVGVYFGQTELKWFDDGDEGETGLALPLSTAPSDLARFVRPRLRGIR